MLAAGDNVVSNTDAVDTFGIPLVPLDEQLRRGLGKARDRYGHVGSDPVMSRPAESTKVDFPEIGATDMSADLVQTATPGSDPGVAGTDEGPLSRPLDLRYQPVLAETLPAEAARMQHARDVAAGPLRWLDDSPCRS